MSEQEGRESPPSLWLVLAMPVSLVVTVLALVFGLLIGVGLDEGREAVATQPSGPGGAAVFVSQGCGACHTLSAAGTTGTVGPNLDETQLSEQQIEETVASGRGGMPAFADRLTNEELAAVAVYVRESASASP